MAPIYKRTSFSGIAVFVIASIAVLGTYASDSPSRGDIAFNDETPKIEMDVKPVEEPQRSPEGGGEEAQEMKNDDDRIEEPKDRTRLTDSSRAYSGRVEVWYERGWRPVCADGFTDVQASVVCEDIGFTGPFAQAIPGTDMNDPSTISVSISCDGTEHKVTSCTYYDWGENSCSSSLTANVHCFGHLFPDIKLPTTSRPTTLSNINATTPSNGTDFYNMTMDTPVSEPYNVSDIYGLSEPYSEPYNSSMISEEPYAPSAEPSMTSFTEFSNMTDQNITEEPHMETNSSSQSWYGHSSRLNEHTGYGTTRTYNMTGYGTRRYGTTRTYNMTGYGTRRYGTTRTHNMTGYDTRRYGTRRTHNMTGYGTTRKYSMTTLSDGDVNWNLLQEITNNRSKEDLIKFLKALLKDSVSPTNIVTTTYTPTFCRRTDYYFLPSTGRCYKLHREQVIAQVSANGCKREGARLVSFESAKELYDVGAHFSRYIRNAHMWTSGRIRDNRLVWSTDHANIGIQPRNYRWFPGFRYPYKGETHCIGFTLRPRKHPVLFDFPCHTPHQFVCEMPPGSGH